MTRETTTPAAEARETARASSKKFVDSLIQTLAPTSVTEEEADALGVLYEQAYALGVLYEQAMADQFEAGWATGYAQHPGNRKH